MTFEQVSDRRDRAIGLTIASLFTIIFLGTVVGLGALTIAQTPLDDAAAFQAGRDSAQDERMRLLEDQLQRLEARVLVLENAGPVTPPPPVTVGPWASDGPLWAVSVAGPPGHVFHVWAWTADGNRNIDLYSQVLGSDGRASAVVNPVTALPAGPATLIADVLPAGVPRDPRPPDAQGRRSRVSIVVPTPEPPNPPEPPEDAQADVPDRWPTVNAALAAGDRHVTVRAGQTIRSGTIRIPDEPTTIEAVGTGDRPVLLIAGGHGIARERGVGGSCPDLTLRGLKIVPEGRRVDDRREGVRIVVGSGGNISIYDCEITGWSFNLTVQGVTEGQFVESVAIVTSIIANSYAKNNGPQRSHSSGTYLERVRLVEIFESVFDGNGWLAGGDGTGRTMFNHGAYVQGNSERVIVKDSMFTRNAAHGLQARPGGDVKNSLFAYNALAAFTGPTPSTFEDNVVLFSDDIRDTPDLWRGWGLEQKAAPQTAMIGNVAAYPRTRKALSEAFYVGRSTADRADPKFYDGPWRLTFHRNALVGWPSDQILTILPENKWVGPVVQVDQVDNLRLTGSDAHEEQLEQAVRQLLEQQLNRPRGQPSGLGASIRRIRALALEAR